jgi:hypothetical protein
MPYSYNVYTGNGSTTQFTVGFPYIRQEHVKVYVAYVDTAYTYVNNTTVQLATAPGAGVRVEVRRITPVASVLVDFADGSWLLLIWTRPTCNTCISSKSSTTTASKQFRLTLQPAC